MWEWRNRDFQVSGIFQIKNDLLQFPAPTPSSLFPCACTLFSAAGPAPAPARTDVDSCFQALPVNHFWFFRTLELCVHQDTPTYWMCLGMQADLGRSPQLPGGRLWQHFFTEALLPASQWKRKTETLLAFLLLVLHRESPDSANSIVRDSIKYVTLFGFC